MAALDQAEGVVALVEEQAVALPVVFRAGAAVGLLGGMIGLRALSSGCRC